MNKLSFREFGQRQERNFTEKCLLYRVGVVEVNSVLSLVLQNGQSM